MRQDRDWRVDSYKRETARHGSFFVTVYSDATVTAQRVWGEHPNLRTESLGGVHASVDAAKAACEARLLELELELAGDEPGELDGRCSCGAALSYYAGCGASGVLCTACHPDKAAELETELGMLMGMAP